MSDSLFNKDRFRDAMGEMSVVDLADRLGCPKSSVSMYLSGQRSPSKMAIQLIALNLGVNPAWLCGLDVPKYSNAKIVAIENAPTEDGRRNAEFIELFSQLDENAQALVVAQIRGILESSK